MNIFQFYNIFACIPASFSLNRVSNGPMLRFPSIYIARVALKEKSFGKVEGMLHRQYIRTTKRGYIRCADQLPEGSSMSFQITLCVEDLPLHVISALWTSGE
jgi:hypothetical protein